MVHRLSNTQDPRRWEMGRLTRFRGALLILVPAVALTNTTGAAYIADNIKLSSEPKIYNTTTDAFTALNAGQIDAVLLDTPIVLGAIKAGQVKDAAVVGQFKTGEEYGAVLNKGSP